MRGDVAEWGTGEYEYQKEFHAQNDSENELDGNKKLKR